MERSHFISDEAYFWYRAELEHERDNARAKIEQMNRMVKKTRAELDTRIIVENILIAYSFLVKVVVIMIIACR